MALTCSRLVSIESFGVVSLPSLAGLAAGGFLALMAVFASLALGGLAAALPPAAAAGAASTFFLSFPSLTALVSLSLRFSASELVRFLSNEEPFVTINFYRRT